MAESTEQIVRGGRRREESERRRQRILDAARRCFGELGFAGAKVETIAAEAGVSNGLLYQFFRNKEHLFEVVLEDLVRDWRRAMVAGGDASEAGAAAALAEMFRRSVAFARSHPLLPALLTDDALLELSRFSDRGERWSAMHHEHVCGLLRAGIRAGELRRDLDVEAAADVICQLQVDYSSRAYRRRPGQRADDAVVEAAIRMVVDSLRAKGAH